MAVFTPQGKVKWMFCIPVMVAMVGLTVALWLLPGRGPVSFSIVGTIVCTIVLLLVGSWSIWGDVEQGGEK